MRSNTIAARKWLKKASATLAGVIKESITKYQCKRLKPRHFWTSRLKGRVEKSSQEEKSFIAEKGI